MPTGTEISPHGRPGEGPSRAPLRFTSKITGYPPSPRGQLGLTPPLPGHSIPSVRAAQERHGGLGAEASLGTEQLEGQPTSLPQPRASRQLGLAGRPRRFLPPSPSTHLVPAPATGSCCYSGRPPATLATAPHRTRMFRLGGGERMGWQMSLLQHPRRGIFQEQPIWDEVGVQYIGPARTGSREPVGLKTLQQDTHTKWKLDTNIF